VGGLQKIEALPDDPEPFAWCWSAAGHGHHQHPAQHVGALVEMPGPPRSRCRRWMWPRPARPDPEALRQPRALRPGADRPLSCPVRV